MAGPWEEYQTSTASEEVPANGPWMEFNTEPRPVPAPVPAQRMYNAEAQRLASARGRTSPTLAFAQGAGDMATLGTMDEIQGVMGGILSAATNWSEGRGSVFDPQPNFLGRALNRFKAGQQNALANSRASMQAAQEKHPIATTAGGVTGGIVTALGGAGIARNAKRLHRASTAVPAAAASGAGIAGLYKFNSNEGGIKKRTEGVAREAVQGAVFGAGLSLAGRGLSAAAKKAFTEAETMPSLTTLKEAKNAAYDAVEASGHSFKAEDTKRLWFDALADAADNHYVPETDAQTRAALRLLERNAGRPMSLQQLDKVRQNLWKRYQAAPNETVILDIIHRLDGLVDSQAGASASMSAARTANAQYKKAELLTLAFQKADDQTAATGGNLAKRYRSAVSGILNNPSKARFFSKEEQAVMRAFLQGDTAENIARKGGSISPNANGLIMALNLVAASIDPTALAVGGASALSGHFADKIATKGAQGIVAQVATGKTPRPAPYPTGTGTAGGIAAALTGQDQ